MTRQEILDRVRPIIGCELVADLGCDSLGSVEIVMAIEDEWEVEISDEAWEAVRTVDDVITAVETVLKERLTHDA
jgi:acyl carrier protein